MRLVRIAIAALLVLGCSTDSDEIEPPPAPEATLVLTAIDLSLMLPGTTATVTGVGFSANGSYQARFVGAGTDREIPVRYVDDAHLEVEFEPGLVTGLPPGPVTATLVVTAVIDGLDGRAELPVQAEVVQRLQPRLDSVALAVFPASPVQVIGDGFIAGTEGETLIEIRGTYTNRADLSETPVEVTVEGRPPVPEGWRRDEVVFIFDPAWVGIEPGRIEAEVRVINGGRGWSDESDWRPFSFDLLEPAIDPLTTLAASRGEAVRISGQGFLGSGVGGVTTLRLNGTFQTRTGQALPIDGLELNPVWESGTSLVFSFRVMYEFGCESADLGATPGRLEGTVTPIINLDGRTVTGGATPLSFDILPTKQVVWLKFLPAFTDSLRLFGLRNVSGEVRDRVLEVIRRDYDGINLEVRLSEPTDFLEYSIVEIGGPDPNGGQLFGLDNTPDLDHCNQRLDDFIAGRNADSEGYGGIFVESFLQLSPSRGTNDNPLKHDAFDEIFDPVLGTAVEAGEYPGGGRDDVIRRAIHTLGNLVGNTATHEIGHSLGLPRAPECGAYHNAAGDRQIMDCGADRPFEERAELTPGSNAVWTPENRRYLEEILPLP